MWQSGRHGSAARQGGWPALVVAVVLAGLFARIWTPLAPTGWTPPGFCHAGPAAGDHGLPGDNGHDHCPLCQVAFGAPSPPPAMPTIHFATLRSTPTAPPIAAPPAGRTAYISRAPPAA